MGGVLKRSAVAVVLFLAVFGMAACGDDTVPRPQPKTASDPLAELITALKKGSDDHARAVDALSKLGVKSTSALMDVLMHSDDVLQRVRAAGALGNIGARLAWEAEVPTPDTRSQELKGELSEISDALQTTVDANIVHLSRTAGDALVLIWFAGNAGFLAAENEGPGWDEWWDRNKGLVAVAAWAKVSQAQVAEARKLGVPVAFKNDIGMVFVLLPSGTFVMGSPVDEEGRSKNEPEYEVTFTRPLYMQITEVTNEQYRRWKAAHSSGTYTIKMRGDGLHDLDADHQPVVRVSRRDADGFAAWVGSRDEGRSYRLPTEAEWEYACRARSTGRFAWGEEAEDAHLFANALDSGTVTLGGRWAFPIDDGQTVSAPVGFYSRNRWGLHDMHGNVWELCRTTLSLDATTVGSDAPASLPDVATRIGGYLRRGGSWQSPPSDVRSARRANAVLPSETTGFRLVSPLPESSS